MMKGMMGSPENENIHLCVSFKLSAAPEVVDAFIEGQESHPELTGLFRLLNDFGAHVRPLGRMFNGSPIRGLEKAYEDLKTGPRADSIRRTVDVTLSDDGNLKTLIRNLRLPVFAAVVDPDSVQIGVGPYTENLCMVKEDGTFLPAERKILPPPFPPKKAGFKP